MLAEKLPPARMPFPQNHVKNTCLPRRHGSTAPSPWSKAPVQMHDSSSWNLYRALFHSLDFCHPYSLEPHFLPCHPHRPALSIVSILPPLRRVLSRIVMRSLPLLYFILFEPSTPSASQPVAFLSPYPSSGATVGRLIGSAGQSPRLTEAVYLDTTVCDPTSASCRHSASPSQFPTVSFSQRSASGSRKTKNQPAGFYETALSVAESNTVFPSTWSRVRTSLRSPRFLTQRSLHEDATARQTSSQGDNNKNVDPLEGPSGLLFLKDATQKAWTDSVASKENVAHIKALSLQEPSGVFSSTNPAQQLPTVYSDFFPQETSKGLPPKFPEEAFASAELSALMGFINEPPHNEQVGHQLPNSGTGYGERIPNLPVLSLDGGIVRQTGASREDFTRETDQDVSASSTSSFQYHSHGITSERNGMVDRARTGILKIQTGPSSKAGTRHTTAQSSASLRQFHTTEANIEERNLTSVTVVFSFQLTRPYSTTFVLLPVVFSSPSPPAPLPAPIYLSAFSPHITSQLSSPSLLRPSFALPSPPAYVPALYLIPVTVDDNGTALQHEAASSQPIVFHPTIFSRAPSFGTAPSRDRDVIAPGNFLTKRPDMQLESSPEESLPRTVIPASASASPATAAQRSPPLSSLPFALSSLVLNGLSLLASGSSTTHPESSQFSPFVNHRHGAYTTPHAEGRRDRDASKGKTEAKSADEVERLTDFSTSPGYHMRKFALAFPLDAGATWTHLLPAVRSPRRQSPPPVSAYTMPTAEAKSADEVERLTDFATSPGYHMRKFALAFPLDAGATWTHLLPAVRSPRRQSPPPVSAYTMPTAPGSGWSGFGTTDRFLTSDTAVHASTPSSTSIGAGVRDFWMTAPDLPMLKAPMAPSFYGNVKGRVPDFAKEQTGYETTSPPEGFQTAPVASKWSSQSRTLPDLQVDMKVALRHILDVLTVITGIDPASLLHFVSGTHTQAEATSRPREALRVL